MINAQIGITPPTFAAGPCPCGQPTPPGRTYCSWRCRFEDDDHGPDYTEDAA